MLVQSFLEESADRCPEKTALVCQDRRITYAALEEGANRFASALLDLGLRAGERVAIHLHNSPEAVISIFGALKAGGVFLVVNPLVTARRLHRILRDCQARFLVTEYALAGNLDGACPDLEHVIFADGAPGGGGAAEGGASWVLDELLQNARCERPDPRRDEQELCSLIYTSGSTGGPKGVMLSHRNMTVVAEAIIDYLENTPEDVILDLLPLAFDYGLYNVLMPLRFGGTVVLEKGFSYPYQVTGLIRKESVTGLPLVPTISAILLRFPQLERCELSSVRYVTNTGQPLPSGHIARLQRVFTAARIYSMYGLTECKRVSFLPPEQLSLRPTSVGRPIANTRAYIVDERGEVVTRPGVAGELVVEGEHVMQGYWGRPEETLRIVGPGSRANHRTLRTGDLFRMDEEGYLYFVARKDELIKTAGERVSPGEIEELLRAMPGIAEAAAFGVPHDLLGQAVAVALVPAGGAPPGVEEVLEHCARTMEKSMIPRHVEFLDELPANPSGKTDYAALRARHRAEQGLNAEGLNSMSEWLENLKKNWKKLRRLHPIAVDLERIERIRERSLAELGDPRKVHDLILELGLNDDGLDEMPAELHRFCGQGLRIWQYPIQFSEYLVELSRLQVRSYLELGIRHGGTFITTVEYLERFHPLEFAVGVDIMPCPSMAPYAELNPRASFRRLNTQSDEFLRFVETLAEIDLVFIDANHFEEECRGELEAVKDRAGIIALHDVHNVDFPTISSLWKEIKATDGYACREFIRQYEGIGPHMGIGMLIREDRRRP